MPPRITEKNPEFYVLLHNGKKIMLGEIEEIKTISDREDFYEPLFYTSTQEYEFTCRWNPDIRTLYFVLHGRLSVYLEQLVKILKDNSEVES